MLLRYCRVGRGLSVVSLLLALCGTVVAQKGEPDRPTVDDVLRELSVEFGPKEGKYRSLVKAVRKSVEKHLGQFEAPLGGGVELTLEAHPRLGLVAELADAARERGKGKKNSAEVKALLEAYPWHEMLELPRGLEYGSDRAIPPNHDGFIVLNGTPDPLPGYPELTVNHYLYGLGEIASWNTGVKVKKGEPEYVGRTAGERARAADELPSWEALRVYLSGSVPDVPLLAIPELTHRIHQRLVERRREDAGGERAPVDELLTLFDSKWNGFCFETPYTKEPISIAVPVIALFADRNGFLNRFGDSEQLASVGDLPFLAIQSYMEYGERFQGSKVTSGDFISHTAAGEDCTRKFEQDIAYLCRYRMLLDLIVRALLTPEVAYPSYLVYHDYPKGRLPEERSDDRKYDVSRRHAVLLWAAMDRDPERLADWLHDEVLSRPENRMPTKKSPAVAFLVRAREKQEQLLGMVRERTAAARVREASGKSAEGLDPYALEFSPYEDFLMPESGSNATAVAASFHAYHAALSREISAAAYDVVKKALK